jgi:hypothetical protein
MVSKGEMGTGNLIFLYICAPLLGGILAGGLLHLNKLARPPKLSAEEEAKKI